MPQVISTALGNFLSVTVAIQEGNGATLPLFKDARDMFASIILAVHKIDERASHAPILQFVNEAIDVYGHLAEVDVCSVLAEAPPSTPRNGEIRQILESLLMLSFEAVRGDAGCLWSHGMEQGRGEQPFEASPKLEPKGEVKSPDEVSAMFSILAICTERCPSLLVQLSIRSGSDQEEHGFFIRSVAAAALSLNEKEADVARGGMLFLKSLVSRHYSTAGKITNVGDYNDTKQKLLWLK